MSKTPEQKASEYLEMWASTLTRNGQGSRLPQGFMSNKYGSVSLGDVAASTAAYVEMTPGFGKYRPALKAYYLTVTRPKHEPILVRRFRRILTKRIKSQPWMGVGAEEVMCSEDIARANAAVQDFTVKGRERRMVRV